MSTLIVPDRQEVVNENLKIWAIKKRASRKTAARLFRAGLKNRAARMYECGDYLVTHVDEVTGELKTDTQQLCRDRLCPICEWRLSLRRFAEMMAVLNMLQPEIIENNYHVSMLTLTVRNMPLEELRSAIEAFSKAWHDMSRREFFKGAVVGWSRSLEITYNNRTNTYHPHYHCILIWRPDEDSTEITAKVMKKAWKDAYNCDYDPIIDIRDVYSNDDDGRSSIIKSALEAFKYAVKPDSVDKVPQEHLAEFANAISGVRFVSYGRAIKEARKSLGFRQTDTAETLDTPTNLPDKAIIAVMRWNGTAYTRTTLEAEPWRLSKDRLAKELELTGEDENECN